MSLEDMAKKMQENTDDKKFDITGETSKGVFKQSIRTTAADLLSNLAKEKGFKETDECCEFMGSKDNQEVVYEAIVERYGKDEAEKYEPTVNVKPKTKWLQEGYLIKDKEIPLCFIVTWRSGRQWTVALYHQNQVELSV